MKKSMTRSTKGLRLLLCLSVFLAGPRLVYATPIFGSNLIVNGDAEAGAGAPDVSSIVPVPGWTTSGNFTAVQYNAPTGFPTSSDPGPPNRGANFFAGGPSNASSSASQVIDVSMGAATIDAGGVTFDLAGFLGGFDSQGDNTVLTTTFLSASNMTLGTASIGPVTLAERSDLTGLLLRSTMGTLPIGTREITVALQMTRLAGVYNDGYADNLALILTTPNQTIPEPSTLALLGSSMFGLLLYGRQQRKSM